MQKFEIALKKINVDIANLDIIAKNIVVLIALNFLDSQYETWVTILSQKIRDDKKLLDLDSLFENLREKEHRYNQFEKITLAREEENRDREDREDERDENNENNFVDDNDREEECEERDKENDREDREDNNVAKSENDSQSSEFELNNNCKNREKNHINKIINLSKKIEKKELKSHIYTI